MAFDTSVVPDLPKVAIRTSENTRSSVEVVIDNTSHILAGRTVSGVESTFRTRLVTGHTTVNDVLTVVASGTCLSALCIEWMFVVFLTCVVCTLATLCALLVSWAETQFAAISTVLTESAAGVAIQAIRTSSHTLESCIVEEHAELTSTIRSTVVCSSYTCHTFEATVCTLVIQ